MWIGLNEMLGASLWIGYQQKMLDIGGKEIIDLCFMYMTWHYGDSRCQDVDHSCGFNGVGHFLDSLSTSAEILKDGWNSPLGC